MDQLELVEIARDPDGQRGRATRTSTFVVAGAGYAGTEMTAELQSATGEALRYYPGCANPASAGCLPQKSDRVLPQLGDRLPDQSLRMPRRRGVEVRLRTTIEQAGPGWVRLSGGERVYTET